MNALSAYGELRALDVPVIRTMDAATRLKTSSRNAVRLLRDAEKADLVDHLKHGLWLLERSADRQVLGPYLTEPFPAYVSFWAALAQHDMIEQIPRMTYVASLARTQRIATSLGEFSIHHLLPEVFGGFTEPGPGRFLATPEKALFDSVYVRSVRGTGFRPPELTLPESFDHAALDAWVAKIASRRLRTLTTRSLDRTLSAAL